MSGRYDDIESLWLLPEFMRSDAFDAEMSKIVDDFGADVSAATRTYSVWDSIDVLGEATLDALAEELNIIWYDKTADVEAKRSVVKNSKRIQAKLGTPGGLVEILKIYFSGDVAVTEWFDYEDETGIGEPNHFRVEAEYLSGTAENVDRFLAVMSQVKRKSAILDKVLAVVRSECWSRASAWLESVHIDTMTARREP